VALKTKLTSDSAHTTSVNVGHKNLGVRVNEALGARSADTTSSDQHCSGTFRP
jgi:hypothetical protein